jgi:hypothetical protein
LTTAGELVSLPFAGRRGVLPADRSVRSQKGTGPKVLKVLKVLNFSEGVWKGDRLGVRSPP